MKKAVYVFLSLIFIVSCKKNVTVINIGALFDETGPTKDAGKDYAEAVKDYFKYLNEKGGINGRKINLQAKKETSKIL